MSDEKRFKKKGLATAKKGYKQWRKRALAAAKAETKSLKTKALARIRRMPVAHRVPARKRLKEQLKKRSDALKEKYPTKVKSVEHLRTIMKR